MKYRGRYEIFATILEVISSKEASKTTIMYKSFLSHAQLKEYLALLLEKRLVEEYYRGDKQKKGFFRLTDKGMHFLFLFNEINNSLAHKP
jgi:predicted transcriptional regulator